MQRTQDGPAVPVLPRGGEILKLGASEGIPTGDERYAQCSGGVVRPGYTDAQLAGIRSYFAPGQQLNNPTNNNEPVVASRAAIRAAIRDNGDYCLKPLFLFRGLRSPPVTRSTGECNIATRGGLQEATSDSFGFTSTTTKLWPATNEQFMGTDNTFAHVMAIKVPAQLRFVDGGALTKTNCPSLPGSTGSRDDPLCDKQKPDCFHFSCKNEVVLDMGLSLRVLNDGKTAALTANTKVKSGYIPIVEYEICCPAGSSESSAWGCTPGWAVHWGCGVPGLERAGLLRCQRCRPCAEGLLH